ncbi:MAG: extracellular solute-binding protein [Oscillospiraceae bacterium]|jgi:raffinose/stachyose/melibiose transport system substrate-binding protein|nr:extracellular solute-binding protein [Oscillospiraceae bacterium]
MKKTLAIALCTLLLLAPAVSLADGVQLTMGSWRVDDSVQVEAMLAKYKELSGVEIVFQPTTSAQYNSVLRMQLDAGTGPDLMYARSYETGRDLYEAGFLVDVSGIPGVKENFAPSSLEPWQNTDGSLFAVPFAAVSQVIYYDKDIFAEQGIEVPYTWDEFIAACDKLLAAGITPIANGLGSNWDILECVFLGMLPNYVGGSESRALYESGEKALNDEAFVKAYTDFQQMTKYFPEGFESIGNDDAVMVFATGRAAMVMDGSWSCGTNDEYGANWGTMAFPVPEGGEAAMCFHPDMAIAGNSISQYPDEVAAFLEWIATPEGAQIVADYLPAGFFPMIDAPITFKNERVTEILALNEGRVTDARFVWPKLMGLYNPMLEQLNALARGETTPQAAADAVAAAK